MYSTIMLYMPLDTLFKFAVIKQKSISLGVKRFVKSYPVPAFYSFSLNPENLYSDKNRQNNYAYLIQNMKVVIIEEEVMFA